MTVGFEAWREAVSSTFVRWMPLSNERLAAFKQLTGRDATAVRESTLKQVSVVWRPGWGPYRAGR